MIAINPQFKRLKNQCLRAFDCLRTGSRAPRSCLAREDLKLIYVIQYKAACSSILESVSGIESTVNHHRIHGVLGGSGRVRRCVNLLRRTDCYRFTFVRNPLARLVSTYENKHHEDMEALPGQAGKRRYFDHYLFGYLKRDRGFADFAQRVARIPDRLADHHFVSQASRVFDWRGRKLVDFIGRVEELPEAYAPIAERFGVPPLEHHNRSGKGNWMDYYDLETARLVIERYRRDLDAFGYRGSADALMNYLSNAEIEPTAEATEVNLTQ